LVILFIKLIVSLFYLYFEIKLFPEIVTNYKRIYLIIKESYFGLFTLYKQYFNSGYLLQLYVSLLLENKFIVCDKSFKPKINIYGIFKYMKINKIFNYERDTKNYYLSKNIAEQYHVSFTSLNGLKGLRFKLIANRERSIVNKFLLAIPHSIVLDMPAGTGKLASVFAKLGSKVVSADISENMLSIAMKEYECIDYEKHVKFVICDAEKMLQTLTQRFEVAVCLRLLHRVPSDIQSNILEQLAYIARYSIVSFGLNSRWHKLRRKISKIIFDRGNLDVPLSGKLSDIMHRIQEQFEILKYNWVLPILSEEVVFLLRSFKWKD